MQIPFVRRRLFEALNEENARLRALLERAEQASRQFDQLSLERLTQSRVSEMAARAEASAAQLRIAELESVIDELETTLRDMGAKPGRAPAPKRVPESEVRRIAREQIAQRNAK